MATGGLNAAGVAPRALFLHGAGAWGGQWAIWRRVFEAEAWWVDTPDLQPVAAGCAATRLEDYLAQARAALEARPTDLLVGASLGGLLALAAATGRGTSPRALVLVNPLPPAPWAVAPTDEAAEPEVLPWRSQGRFDSTVRALPKASFHDHHHAFRHWRDESAAAVREARAGIVLAVPGMPVLVISSASDRDVPPELVAAFADGIGASLLRVPGSHVDPVMGASAAAAAKTALAWSSMPR